ncbi:MAG TPA: histidine phosphatase family protein [Mycobacteriales bacterium]|nr:histidine phosphatase family protein [Mycobacteriales bacterium]
MTTVLLIRHGRTAANAGAVLAGWTPGVALDETGQAQAERLSERLAPVPLAALVCSPLERCRQTAEAVAKSREVGITEEPRVGEVHYGDWTGAALKDLAKKPLWKVVQSHPSAAVFPGDGGEGLAAVQARAVGAVRQWNERLGPDAVYAVFSHGDVIKSILADALGLHLDLFQRIVVDPCSVSVISYTDTRPFVARSNDTGGDVTALLPQKKKRGRKRSDAAVGGGAGPSAGGGAVASARTT